MPAGRTLGRVTVDGKQFAVGGARFPFHGVSYGTFLPREDGALFPERERAKRDFAAMREAGFTVVRTYTEPTDDLLELAADWDLKVLAGVFFPDWRYLLGASRRDGRRVLRDASREVAGAAARLAGRDEVLALSLGNEVPADVVRWAGTGRIAAAIAELVEVAKAVDPEQLVTYGNYPTTEYLSLETLDFSMFNVFLERRLDLTRYLNRLHHLAGDRPLVLGEMGLDSGGTPAGEQRQADLIDWQLEVALERGVAGTCLFSWTDEWAVGGAEVQGWHFGITSADRTPKPALDVAAKWNALTVAELSDDWPSISVVICAYNAEVTLDECLRHTCSIEYPDVDIVVVDDGSTDATAAIARRHPRARLVEIEHAGLSVARNAGRIAARGDIVAYLDSDAYPGGDWLYYLALGFDDRMVGGVGGPNVPPADDPPGAHRVARAPGGPVHVLVADDRAEHVPGCNMAFWKQVLDEVGGFDPIYTSAGDDVDLCWKVLDRGWEIGFHPAALVWHHRRAGARAYLRQQRGYGRAEALVEARHPDRFTPLGTARWRGRIYDSFAPSLARQRVYRGLYGTAAYQSVYRGGGHGLDLAHQVGVPLAVPTLVTAPLGLLHPALAGPALLAAVLLLALVVVDLVEAGPPRTLAGNRRADLWFRAGVAGLHLAQPLVRTWGRLRHAPLARRGAPRRAVLGGPARRIGRRVLLLPAARARADVAADVIVELRSAGFRVVPSTGWEDHDALVVTSLLVQGELVSSAHPEGCVQVRVRLRPRRTWAVGAGVALVLAGLAGPAVAATVALVIAAEVARGSWRAWPGVRAVLEARAGTVAA